MKIILRQNVEKLGAPGKIIEVKDGYARNFLLPKGWAYLATKSNIELLDAEKKRKREVEIKAKEDLKTLAEKINEISCTVTVRAGEKEKIFGSVTKEEIIAALDQEHGIKLDKKLIVLSEPIKKLGVYKIPLKLNLETESNLKLWVVKE
ncbi:MAG: 50S ribosomal protein L9 [bacterium (Candidatus Ratteibacteria) CG_4_10_14_3_um_filter_41_18]|uniref:Large ribosomal subunit protein bL9 n=4 Tax=Candidatus Ratteibacteria TaxID=2979319 RepID=A0A2M7YFZ5_9BACT|nr:MAG: 50S ribosomal protein L9 [Candidatus Omnitrophica bacterium CG1_02_41_171]PIV64624.1 MAG: 50S ribosomal protein L9 [bacterium (Candidatus Ratteibacteria) CG01_land_8_20_14_3_00_40_19]PIW32913.1 MAG: 50S ribosomal protein L9 [bacterium (Candidatus Ratteibacteria) CG15_BIG_FIL_POST_REV_8_21_14_020_41_12]PIW74526.1 MAG: 50S ribosomal protein L9 [bacterium (Candidatus Ratteibacteria) CG_4_8_14_3_um_filter_41_36]PIX77826.1 MAG: 50S ribosomal protein L9 [bacterium (Candidatus Ratteibacteria) 